MPALQICGKRTFLNGDDIRCCVAWNILGRILELCCIIPLLVYSLIGKIRHTNIDNNDNMCADNILLKHHKFGWFYAYLWLALVQTIILCVLDSRVWVVSGWGTPTKNTKRSAVLKRLLVWKHLYLFVWKVGMACFGAFLWKAVKDYCACSTRCTSNNNGWRTLLRILVICQYAEALLSAIVCVLVLYKHAAPTKYVCWCCSRQCCIQYFVCFCCSFGLLLGGDSVVNGDFTTLSLLLNDYLGGPVDVVVSDILAAIIMLKRRQTERRLECQESLNKVMNSTKQEQEGGDTTGAVEPQEVGGDEEEGLEMQQHVNHHDSSTGHPAAAAHPVLLRVQSQMTTKMVERQLLTRNNHDDLNVIAEGARFIQVATAIYTWLMQFLHSPVHECCCVLSCGTLSHCVTCQPIRRNDRVIGDNPCGWNQASLRNRAGDVEVVYAQFKNGVIVQPYCIVLDHEWRSVAVVIRGTLSLDDLMTDLAVQPACLEDLGKECGFDGSQSYAHKGILASAEWIYNDMKRHGILDELLLEEDARYKDYQLRVVGHSLGASCACLVGLLLKSKFPALRCLCFCPAGATVSKDLADECKDYLTSYVLDSDFVPRLSLSGLEHLRDDVLEMVAKIKVPKYQTMKRYAGAVNKDDVAKRNRTILYESESLIPETQYKEELAQFHRDQETRRQERAIEDVALFPPGRIVHLVQSGTSGKHALRRLASALTCGDVDSPRTTHYRPLWADVVDFQEIELTSHFLDDHDPENVCRELERVAESFGLSSPAYLPPLECKYNA